jgi:hypothetical protein
MMFVIVQLEQQFHVFFQDQQLNVDEFLQFQFVFLLLFLSKYPHRNSFLKKLLQNILQNVV